MNDYSELKKRALDATPGPWYEQDDEDSAAGAVFIMPESDLWTPPICRITTEFNAAYIAAANPAVILELIAESESLRKIAEELLRSVDCNHVHHCKADQHEYDEPCKVILRIKSALNRSPENP